LAGVSLSREVILQAALDVVDTAGLEALTMRRLATHLGVATMSLYSHVPTKDDLLLGVVNMASAQIALPGPDAPPWEAIRSIIREFRRVAKLHPNLVPLITRGPPAGPDSLRTLDAALDALRRAGLDPARRACAYRLTSSFAIGFVSLEAGGYFRPLGEAGGGRDIDVEQLGTMPAIMETGVHLAVWDSDAEFESGMDVLIEALVRDLPPAADPLARPGQAVQGDGRRGGDVEGVDA
jgi:TetR/AcrR family tetracycline transcriptional repressor